MYDNAQITDVCKIVQALAPVTPSSSTPRRVSMKNFDRVTVQIQVKNATTVTGSAITLHQSQTVAGGGEKALAFTTARRNIDTAAAGGDVLADFAVSSNTFTTDSTNSKDLIYFVDVKAEDLDRANGFDVLRVGTGNATAAVVSASYIMHKARYASPAALSVITD